MKLFVFLLGIAVGAFGLNYYYTLHPEDAPHLPAPSATEQARQATARKLAEWHLTGPEIREEMERTGKIVRTHAAEAGHSLASTFSETRITTVINAKLALDKELASRTIHVDCKGGVVTLTGTVSSTAQISKAVAHALDTEGVSQVSSFLVVQVPATPDADGSP